MGCGDSKTNQAVQATEQQLETKQQIEAAVQRHGGPRDALCHICGRKYTIHSIDIHVPQCEKLWRQRQELLPPQERKPVPTLQGDPKTMTLEKRNEMALELHTQDALEECHYCGRTFLPDRLKVHVPSCERNHKRSSSSSPPISKKHTKSPTTKASPLKTGTTIQQQSHNNKTTTTNNSRASRDALQACGHCGRKFYSDRLQVHLRSCVKPSKT
jgi:hypothetical protein